MRFQSITAYAQSLSRGSSPYKAATAHLSNCAHLNCRRPIPNTRQRRYSRNIPNRRWNTAQTKGVMSGFNRFLTRRRSGSRQRKVMSPPSLLPIPPVSPTPLSLDGQCASSFTEGVTDCFPSRRKTSSSSLCSLSLAFPDSSTGKGAPDLQATETLVYASTANSLGRYILQPQSPSGQLSGLFSADKKNPLAKDEKDKVRLRFEVG